MGPCFSDCSWAECDVDMGRPEATRNALERANFLLEGCFRALYAPLICPFALEWLKGTVIILPKKKKKKLSMAGVFSFFISSLGSPLSFSSTFSSTFSSFLGSIFQSVLALLGYVIV